MRPNRDCPQCHGLGWVRRRQQFTDVVGVIDADCECLEEPLRNITLPQHIYDRGFRVHFSIQKVLSPEAQVRLGLKIGYSISMIGGRMRDTGIRNEIINRAIRNVGRQVLLSDAGRVAPEALFS